MIAYCHMQYIQGVTFSDGKVASLFLWISRNVWYKIRIRFYHAGEVPQEEL